MKIFLQQINVLSPGSEHHLTVRDIYIENGVIVSIEPVIKNVPDDSRLIDGRKLTVSSGWFDLHVNFREPGEEFKEDLQTGSLAALRGGFTGVLVMPSTNPPLHSRSAIEYVFSKSKNVAVDLYPAGCISHDRKGIDLSEMFDMYSSGVHVFTDEKAAITDGGLMTRALLYAKTFGGKIFSFPEDKFLSGKGIVHEGIISTSLGLKGSPSVAEEMMVTRDISLAEYTGSHLHFSTISTKGSVDLIRSAKAKGLNITCDVTALHLYFDDEMLSDFDTNYKLKPPLRTRDDKDALIKGIVDGTIDCICSDHTPEDVENKIREFELAAFGASGIETAFSAAHTVLKDKLSLAEIISRFTNHPRAIAGIATPLIKKGQKANLTILDPDINWVVEEKYLLSKSKNNPFIGKTLTGKPFATINKGILTICN